MGGAQAIAALAYGTETIAARRRDRRARATSRCRRPSARSPATSASTASPGPSDVLVRRRRGRRRARSSRSTCWPRPSTAPGSLAVAVSDDAALLDDVAEQLARRAGQRRGDRARRRAGHRDGARARRGVRARAPRADRRRGRGAGAAGPLRRAACSSAPRGATAFGDYVAGSNHTLPTGGAARFASGLSPRHFRRRMSEVQHRRRRGRARAPPGAAIARAEGFDLHAASMEVRENATLMSRRAEIARETAETRDPPDAGPRRHRRGRRAAPASGFLDHMLDLLARHGRLDLDVDGHRRPRDRRAPHGRGHRARARAGARRGARRPRRHHPLRPRRRSRWTRRARCCAIDISGRPLLRLRGRPAARRRPAASTTSWSRSSSARVASTAKLTLHLDGRSAARTPTT